MGPSGRVVPDREVQRLGTLEEMACDGMGGRNPEVSLRRSKVTDDITGGMWKYVSSYGLCKGGIIYPRARSSEVPLRNRS
jgi:hypothetical protein